MDFFARQESSRRTTRYLVLLFGSAFLAVALATAAALTALYAGFASQTTGMSTVEDFPGLVVDHWSLLAGIVAVTLVLMMLASLFRSATLSRGGGQVARMLGGTQVQGDDPDPLHRRLINVVEEMSIASGLPVPEIYVLEQEAGINAFAAGSTHADAAIAVTRGSLERLSRAELQGVVAHEFSHVLNGDMRLNLRLMGFGFGILVLSLIGRWMLRGSRLSWRSRNRGAGAVIAIGAALTAIGAIGVLLSRLIKAAVSRQREVLADASAVQFTREPLALAGALKKIGGFTTHLKSIEAEEVSHMLFGRGTRSFRGWFATHPPLDERIRALDPSFEPGGYVSAEDSAPQPHAPETGMTSALASGGAEPGVIDVDSAGSVASAETGAALRAALPEELYHAAHGIESSYLLVLALAVDRDAETSAQQYGLLEARIGAQRAAICRRLRAALAELDRRLWLPLLELTVPALKQRPAEQIEYLFDTIDRLNAVDPRPALFEYVLQRLLKVYFDELGLGSRAAQRASRPRVAAALYTLLATVARYGHEDEAAARAAFRAGVARLADGVDARADSAFDRGADAGLEGLDHALELLTRLSPRARRRTLTAVEATIRHDKRIRTAEAELFRVVAAVLGCPIPPAVAIR